MSKYAKTSIACVCIVGLLMHICVSTDPAFYRLSKDEMENTRGGEPCTALTVIYVAGAICGIIQLGWMVVKEFYNGQCPGTSDTELVGDIIVRQQTQYVAEPQASCQLQPVYDYRQEYKLSLP